MIAVTKQRTMADLAIASLSRFVRSVLSEHPKPYSETAAMLFVLDEYLKKRPELSGAVEGLKRRIEAMR
jgi:hypothetical protein